MKNLKRDTPRICSWRAQNQVAHIFHTEFEMNSIAIRIDLMFVECLKMRLQTRKFGSVNGLSTVAFFFFLLSSTFAHSAFLSTSVELNEPTFRTSLIQNHWTSAFLEERLKIEAFDYPINLRLEKLLQYSKGYHQKPELLVLVIDFWNRKNQQIVEIGFFEKDGSPSQDRGRLVGYEEIGVDGDPVLILEKNDGTRRTHEVRFLDFTALIKQHGFREIYEPSWRSGKIKTCRSILF